MNDASTDALRTLLADARTLIRDADAAGNLDVVTKTKRFAKRIERELSRRSLEAYWAGSVSASVAADYEAGNVVEVVL